MKLNGYEITYEVNEVLREEGRLYKTWQEAFDAAEKLTTHGDHITNIQTFAVFREEIKR